MPKYRFVCSSCGGEIVKLVKIGTKEIVCKCGESMSRKMPRLNSIETTETVDSYRNVKWTANHREKLKERKEEYFWKYEVPRLVTSGIYELETMLENDWITITDDGKIEIQDKPPSKR